MLLVLSCGYAYGEIIRITTNTAVDTAPTVNQYGHVLWKQIRYIYNQYGGKVYGEALMYYNGESIIEIAAPVFGSLLNRDLDHHGSVMDGNTVAYAETDGSDFEIYFFDGTNKIKVTENNYKDWMPTTNNGYIAWEGAPDYPNDDTPPTEGYEIFLYKPDQPTAVNMSALKATPANKAVKLNWQTEAEIDNAGFNVWRAEGFQKVNDSMITAEGSPIMGADYDFFDKWVMNGKLYYYLVEDIDTNGISTFHGPVKATPRWIYGVGK
jgi:hypothetical protein